MQLNPRKTNLSELLDILALFIIHSFKLGHQGSVQYHRQHWRCDHWWQRSRRSHSSSDEVHPDRQAGAAISPHCQTPSWLCSVHHTQGSPGQSLCTVTILGGWHEFCNSFISMKNWGFALQSLPYLESLFLSCSGQALVMSVISSERVPFIRSNFSCKIFANSSKKLNSIL